MEVAYRRFNVNGWSLNGGLVVCENTIFHCECAPFICDGTALLGLVFFEHIVREGDHSFVKDGTTAEIGLV